MEEIDAFVTDSEATDINLGIWSISMQILNIEKDGSIYKVEAVPGRRICILSPLSFKAEASEHIVIFPGLFKGVEIMRSLEQLVFVFLRDLNGAFFIKPCV